MRIKPPPECCERCSGTRLVALIWKFMDLDSQAKDAIEHKRAHLGLSHRYFTSVDPTLVVGKFVAKQCDLPSWACLDCSPEWVAVHRLAESEWRVSLAIDAALMAQDFEKAATLHHERTQLEEEHLPKYERLLRELVAPLKRS